MKKVSYLFTVVLIVLVGLSSCKKEDSPADSFAITGIKMVDVTEEGLYANPGDSFKISLEITPSSAAGSKVLWSSTDESVAKVGTDGTVTAVAVGDAVITVMSENGEVSASCVLEVTENPIVIKEIKLVEVPEDGFEMVPGETVRVRAKILPSTASYKKVLWSTSSKSVAAVDSNGLVTAIAHGEATITVSGETGDARSSVNVVVDTTIIRQIEIADVPEEGLVIHPDDSVALRLNILPATAQGSKVLWSSSDSSVAIVDSSGLLTGIGVGNATIAVVSARGDVSASCGVSVVPVEEWRQAGYRDYVGLTKFPFYVMGYEPTIVDDCIHSESPGGWYQYFIDENVSFTKTIHKIVIRMKCSLSGENFNVCHQYGWGQGQQFDQTLTTVSEGIGDFYDYELIYEGCEPNKTYAVILQPATSGAVIDVKSVTSYQSALKGVIFEGEQDINDWSYRFQIPADWLSVAPNTIMEVTGVVKAGAGDSQFKLINETWDVVGGHEGISFDTKNPDPQKKRIVISASDLETIGQGNLYIQGIGWTLTKIVLK